MPTVARFNRCRIEMYFGDHSPPHFHVITNDKHKAVVLIATLAVIEGQARAADIAEAMTWARANRDVLMGLWKRYSDRGCPPPGRLSGSGALAAARRRAGGRPAGLHRKRQGPARVAR